MHKIAYLPLAESDLMEALYYIATKIGTPQADRDLLAAFDETVRRIAQFPYAYELYRDPQGAVEDTMLHNCLGRAVKSALRCPRQGLVPCRGEGRRRERICSFPLSGKRNGASFF